MRAPVFYSVIALTSLMLFSCQETNEAPVAEEVDKEEVKSQIIEIEENFAEAMNLRNADAAVAYYAEDAKSYHSNEDPIEGRQAILESIREELNTVPQGSRVNFRTHEVLVSSDGNQVVEIGTYSVSNATNPSVFSGNFMSVFEKRDGKYVCVRDMAVSDKPVR